MSSSRTKNAKRNIIAGLFNKALMLFFPFIIRTVIVKTLGNEYLGLNSLFTSILQVLNLAELGFSSAIVFSMYKPIAEKDTETICALMNLYKRIYRIIGIIVLIIGMILLPFLPYLIKGSYPQDINIYILFGLYLINTSFTYFMFAYKSALLTAHQRNDLTSNVLAITNIIQYVLQIIVLYTTKNYYLFMVANLLTTALNNVIVNIIANKKYPNYICSGEIDKEMRKDIRKRVTGLMIQRICATTRGSFDSIFISSFFGLNLVAIYNNYSTIMNAVVGIMNIIGNAILAGVGDSIVKEKKEKNYRDMCKFNFMYMWISGICAICMLCLFQPFMTIWMGEDSLLPFGIVILLCLYFYALKMGDISSTYMAAKGLWWENRYRAIGESIANVVLNYILIRFLGLYGVVLGTLISLFIVNFCYGSQILFDNYFTNISIKDYFRRHGTYFGATLIISVITLGICSLIEFSGILELITRTLICITIPNILYLIIYWKTKTFKESKKFVKKIVGRV